MQDNQFLNVHEAAAFLRLAPGTLYNKCSAGKLRYYKPTHGRVLFKKSDLLEMIEGSAIASNDEVAALAAAR